jgi:hypothetical protein
VTLYHRYRRIRLAINLEIRKLDYLGASDLSLYGLPAFLTGVCGKLTPNKSPICCTVFQSGGVPFSKIPFSKTGWRDFWRTVTVSEKSKFAYLDLSVLI